MAVLKYPFYIAGFLFAVLTVYSVSTEKPRQFKAKPIEEAVTKPLSEIWTADEAFTDALKSGQGAPNTNSANSNKTDTKAKSTNTPAVASTSSEPSTQQNTSVVVAYSNNDAGGKIVLTLNKCEKASGTVAYTTAPDGKVDYGCWTFDELYIVINWDKAGVNNYTYDRFIDISTTEKLIPKRLFEVAKESMAKPLITNTAVPANSNGGKK